MKQLEELYRNMIEQILMSPTTVKSFVKDHIHLNLLYNNILKCVYCTMWNSDADSSNYTFTEFKITEPYKYINHTLVINVYVVNELNVRLQLLYASSVNLFRFICEIMLFKINNTIGDE